MSELIDPRDLLSLVSTVAMPLAAAKDLLEMEQAIANAEGK